MVSFGFLTSQYSSCLGTPPTIHTVGSLASFRFYRTLLIFTFKAVAWCEVSISYHVIGRLHSALIPQFISALPLLLIPAYSCGIVSLSVVSPFDMITLVGKESWLDLPSLLCVVPAF